LNLTGDSEDKESTLKYILGLLNSKLFKFLYTWNLDEKGKVYPQIKKVKIEWLPIRTIDFNNPTDKAKHDKMVNLVETMLTLHKQLNEATIPQAKTMLKRQIETTDRQIDSLVYELYGLSDEEVRIVEG
jgi:hypothetical protein